MENTLNLDTGLVWVSSYMNTMNVNPNQPWNKIASDLNNLGYIPKNGEIFIVRVGNDYQRIVHIVLIEPA